MFLWGNHTHMMIGESAAVLLISSWEPFAIYPLIQRLQIETIKALFIIFRSSTPKYNMLYLLPWGLIRNYIETYFPESKGNKPAKAGLDYIFLPSEKNTSIQIGRAHV